MVQQRDFTFRNSPESLEPFIRNLIEKFSKSHGLQIPDALIAATALELGLPLSTANLKDFQYIPDLQLV